jgi:aminoglycoside phosphotransferase (APT) family kinase protein
MSESLPDGLSAVLAAELDATVTGVEVLSDGLNLVAAVSTAEAGRAYTLRRPNKFRQTALFNDLREEYELLERLDSTPIPTPTPVRYWAEESLLGGPFYLATYLDGAVVPTGDRLPERFRRPAARERVGHLLVDTMADLHGLGTDRFEAVCERHSPTDQVERALDRLDAARSVTGREWPRLRRAADWLLANAPAESAGEQPAWALAHGDYRAGNVLLAGTDRPAVGGVLDWEVATLMDPLTELGYFLLYWRDSADPGVDVDRLAGRFEEPALAEVREIRQRGLCPFTTAPGSPTRRALVERYESRTGRTVTDEQLRYYRVHGALMLATVWADLDRHALEHDREPSQAPLVAYMGLVAEGLIEGRLPA